MQPNRNPIKIFSVIMSQQTLNMNYIFQLIQRLNQSAGICRDIITILQDIFKHEKSSKILIAVNSLQYFIKNCNLYFHSAANRQSFQKRLLSLLNRIRGKTNLIKQLNSNTDNWCRIQAKVLYIVQLWYDAFILQESKYPYIINTYKILRKQNVTFPPRSKNQKNLMAIQTQSPIFQNIQQIADEDKKKFCKKLNALGMKHLSYELQKKIQNQIIIKKPKTSHTHSHTNQTNSNTQQNIQQINIDQISQKIAIIQSTQYSTIQTLKTIQQIKKATQFGKVKPQQQSYWKQIKQAAQTLIQEWESKNAQLIQNQEQLYLEKKLGMMNVNSNNKNNNNNNKDRENEQSYQYQEKYQKILNNNQSKSNIIDLLDSYDITQSNKISINNQQAQNNKSNNVQFNLLDM